MDEDRWERRRASRFGVAGEAIWRQGDIEGACRVTRLSTSGLEVAEVAAHFALGARLAITLNLQDQRYEDIPVEVVRLIGKQALALRFVSPSCELQRQIGELTEDRTPLP
jgi:hypothetical protein